MSCWREKGKGWKDFNWLAFEAHFIIGYEILSLNIKTQMKTNIIDAKTNEF